MWRDLLVAEGVPALIRPGDAMTSYLGVTAYPCSIVVDECRLDRARQVLDGVEGSEDGGSPEEAE